MEIIQKLRTNYFNKKKLFKYSTSSILFLIGTILLFTDLTFVFFHILANILLNKEFLYLQNNRGAAETFQWLKLFWISLTFLWLIIFAKLRFLLPISVISIILCIIDIQDLHNLGNPIFRLISCLALITFFISWININVKISNNIIEKKILLDYKNLLFLFGFFVIIIDLLNEIVGYLTKSNMLFHLLTLIEEAGEMITITIILIFSISKVLNFFKINKNLN